MMGSSPEKIRPVVQQTFPASWRNMHTTSALVSRTPATKNTSKDVYGKNSTKSMSWHSRQWSIFKQNLRLNTSLCKEEGTKKKRGERISVAAATCIVLQTSRTKESYVWTPAALYFKCTCICLWSSVVSSCNRCRIYIGPPGHSVLDSSFLYPSDPSYWPHGAS